MSKSYLADRIETFIRTRFAVSDSDPIFSRDVEVFERGYVDSVGVVELLDFVHREFGVAMPDDAVLSDDFSTINGIARLIERHKTNAA